MERRIERSSLPAPEMLRTLLGGHADRIAEGARLVDGEIEGPTGVDLVLADDEGRPILVDIVAGAPERVPTLIFEHLDWFEQNRRLVARAYRADGVTAVEDPGFAFVARDFPPGVTRAVSAMEGIDVRLIRAEYFLVDGVGDVLLEDVTPDRGSRPTATVVRPAGKDGGNGGESADDGIESKAVRTLYALFRSGVDGLDSRITEDTSDGATVFMLSNDPLARVSVSPASFTVSPGDRAENPIVVSDRVSLERALNAVVSLFVREQRPHPDGDSASEQTKLGEEERARLREIWEGAATPGEPG
jgi:hypothetical protein